MSGWKAGSGILLAALLSVPMWSQGAPAYNQGAPQGAPQYNQGGPQYNQGAPPYNQGGPQYNQGAPPYDQGGPPVMEGGPGTLNYVQGEASVGNQTVSQDSIGSVQLQPGQSLSTENGKAEVLLTPGAFLRVGDNSAVQMGFESPTDTAAEITRGQAAVELVTANKHTVLTLGMQNTTTRLVKKGLYEFDANTGQVYTYKGQADVQVGDKIVKVKGGHVLDLNDNPKLKTKDFDKKAFEESDLIQFSGLRSEYLAEANANAARDFYAGGAGWYGPGWYWDPDFWAYTWIPADEYAYDAYGWGFYSPWWVDYDPFFFGGFYGDFGFGSFGHHRFGRHRLPERFEGGLAARERGHALGGHAPAMAGRIGTGGAFNHGATAFNGGALAINHGGMSSAPAFNRGNIGHMGGFHGGGVSAGGFHGGMGGGGFHGGGFGGGHAGGGGFGGGHAGGGGFGGGGFGGGHR
jgi:hypothetical protein